LVLYPKSVTGIIAGREKSINSLNEIATGDVIFVVTQKRDNDPILNINNLFRIGTLCKVINQTDTNNNQKKIVLEGIKKGRIIDFIEDEQFYTGYVEEVEDRVEYTQQEQEEIDNLKKITINKLKTYFNYGKGVEDIIFSLDIFKTIYETIFYSVTFLPTLGIDDRQNLLEIDNDVDRLKSFIQMLDVELNLLSLDKEISGKVDKNLMDYQKKIFLNEKLKVIKKQLGDNVDSEIDEDGEVGRLRKKAKSCGLSEEASEKVKEDLKKMEVAPSYHPEYQTLKNYVETILKLPWNVNTKVDTNLKKVRDVLERDHYGLEKIKDRIIEFVAVYHRKEKLPGQIICFVGPPGVGKTSLAKSIAEALNRKYIKISLGGVNDEAEIRGHRKTYVGAMPGRIIESIKKVGSNNPLILLDEIDKMGNSYKGDPANALLEVLDPEQNKKFNDHFLEVDFDLSDCMFICTANDISSIPIPLRDRMEIIKLEGYTEDEKLNIAKKYLIPGELDLHGLKAEEISIDNKVIKEIIRRYTFEAGVRSLEREIATLIRKTLTKIVTDKKVEKISITTKNLKDFLGVEKFNFNKMDKEDRVGVAVGLAYTDFGGDLLNIETIKFDGTGKLMTTGKLGDVMKESAQAAYSYVRSIANNFNVKAKEFNKYDFHLHVPEGATPKDGPSAGIAITASILSAMTGKKINKNVAMTGEISLTGQVMQIGGLKTKLLAALRGNIDTVVIPKDNEKNLIDIPDNVKKNLKIIPVDNLNDALKFIVKDY
jgi:ATP-dependent Lon protease